MLIRLNKNYPLISEIKRVFSDLSLHAHVSLRSALDELGQGIRQTDLALFQIRSLLGLLNYIRNDKDYEEEEFYYFEIQKSIENIRGISIAREAFTKLKAENENEISFSQYVFVEEKLQGIFQHIVDEDVISERITIEADKKILLEHENLMDSLVQGDFSKMVLGLKESFLRSRKNFKMILDYKTSENVLKWKNSLAAFYCQSCILEEFISSDTKHCLKNLDKIYDFNNEYAELHILRSYFEEGAPFDLPVENIKRLIDSRIMDLELNVLGVANEFYSTAFDILFIQLNKAMQSHKLSLPE